LLPSRSKSSIQTFVPMGINTMTSVRPFALLSLLLLFGCTSTGGIIGGLIPAPKLTKGHLSDGVYTAKDRTFSVGTPFQPGETAYTYMQIDEQYLEDEMHIAFSSSVLPAEVYRIDVLCDVDARNGPKTGVEFSSVARALYSETFVSAHNTPLVPESQAESRPGEFHFVQKIPERNSGFPYFQKIGGFTVRHSSYSFDGNDCVGNIWVNYPIASEDSDFPRMGSAESEGRMAKFVESFHFLEK